MEGRLKRKVKLDESSIKEISAFHFNYVTGDSELQLANFEIGAQVHRAHRRDTQRAALWNSFQRLALLYKRPPLDME